MQSESLRRQHDLLTLSKQTLFSRPVALHSCLRYLRSPFVEAVRSRFGSWSLPGLAPGFLFSAPQNGAARGIS